jgi:hypothetical protein
LSFDRRRFLTSAFVGIDVLRNASFGSIREPDISGRSMTDIPNIPLTSHHRIEADGVTVFYREAGLADAPVVLLLHGFPTSSFQYRELIPRLADRYV